jgi:hypothetical protein
MTSKAKNEQDGPRTSVAATQALRSDSRHGLNDNRYATVTNGKRTPGVRHNTHAPISILGPFSWRVCLPV